MKTVRIEGMHCVHCSTRVKNALEALGLTVKMDLDAGTAVVDGANIPDDNTLREIIEDLGFDVPEIK